MQLHCDMPKLGGGRAFASPTRCSQCGDWMVAPLMSEFVLHGEIRHHWVCETCGEVSLTAIPLAVEVE